MFEILLKFIPKGPIENKSALVQVMALRRKGKKPLPESMMTPSWTMQVASPGLYGFNSENNSHWYFFVVCEWGWFYPRSPKLVP